MTAHQCQRCGVCCRYAIVEAQELDALREPRIAAACGLPQPPANCCEVDNDEEFVCDDDAWDGRVAVLTPQRSQDGKLTGCPFLDATNCCTIYPTRPNVCVAFAPGGKQCREMRTMAEHDRSAADG